MAKRKRKARAERAAPPARTRDGDAATSAADATARPGAASAVAPGAGGADGGDRDGAAAGAAKTGGGSGAVASAATPGGAPRAWSNALIAAFLLFQIAMPLRYYLGGRGYDERFSWRMFSSVRMQRCDVRVRDVLASGAERTVDLERELQVAWIGMLDRYRSQVVDAFLHRRCRADSVRAARYERTCTDTDGTVLPKMQVELTCASRELTREGVGP